MAYLVISGSWLHPPLVIDQGGLHPPLVIYRRGRTTIYIITTVPAAYKPRKTVRNSMGRHTMGIMNQMVGFVASSRKPMNGSGFSISRFDRKVSDRYRAVKFL